MKTKRLNININIIRFSVNLILYCCLFGLNAQVTFNLEDCLEYGVANAPEIISINLDIDRAKIEQKQLQFEQLPSVNIGATHGFNWGQSIDPFTNQFASGRVRTNNLYIGSTWELFRGLDLRYQIKRSDLAVKSASLDAEIAVRNQKLKIITAYIQLQQAHWEVELQKELLAASRTLKKFVDKKQNSGRATFIEQSQATALYAQDSAALISAHGELKYLETNLSQIINVSKDSVGYRREEIQHILNRVSPTLDYNINDLPEIKRTEIEQADKEFAYKSSKAKLLPRLYLNTAVGFGYSGNNTELVGTQLTPKPFLAQMDENFYQTAVLTLNIPVFNNYRVKSEMKIMALEVAQAELLKQQYILDFNRTIEELSMRLENEIANISALELALEAAEHTLIGAEKSFYHGVTNLNGYVQIRKDKVQHQVALYHSILSAYTFSLFLKTYFN